MIAHAKPVNAPSSFTTHKNMFVQFFRISWKYWGASKRGKIKYILAALLLGLTFLGTYSDILMNMWQGKFSDMLMGKKAGMVGNVILTGLGTTLLMTLTARLGDLLQSIISIRWRAWMTEDLSDRWIESGAYFKPQIRKLLDNPDQRISEDINFFTSNIQKLIISFIGAISTLVAFSALVWIKAGDLPVNRFGLHFTLHGYMFWFSITWAIIMTVIAQLIGRVLRVLTIQQQKKEADFRSAAITIRDNAEQIALLKGEKAEKIRLTETFDPVVGISLRLAFFNLRFDTFSGINSWLGMQLPTFLLLPRYFNNELDIGSVMQVASGIASLTLAFQWIVQNYTDIQKYAAVVFRINELENAITRASLPMGPTRKATKHQEIIARDLTLTTPEGKIVLSNVALNIAPGSRWLLRGPSGVGKSTLLRGIAGTWQYGAGEVIVPSDFSSLRMMPQRLYVPYGTLKAALCYPELENSFTDTACKQVLILCNLSDFTDRLNEVQGWQDTMSPGQQQRLGFARLLLHKPTIILLDEATSALDEDNENLMYEQLINALPDSSIISVSHRPNTARYHNNEYIVG